MKVLLCTINILVAGLLGWAMAERYNYKKAAEVFEKAYDELKAENQWLKKAKIPYKVEHFKIETLGCEKVIPKYMLEMIPPDRILNNMARDFADKIVQFAEIEQEPDFMFDQYRIRMRLHVVDRKR